MQERKTGLLFMCGSSLMGFRARILWTSRATFSWLIYALHNEMKLYAGEEDYITMEKHGELRWN
jgi:hypothetical protein